jgi:hypothetical protein
MKKTIITHVIFTCVLVSFSSCGRNRFLQTDVKDILKADTADIIEPIETVKLNEEQKMLPPISMKGKNPKPKVISFFSCENWKGLVFLRQNGHFVCFSAPHSGLN